MKSQFFIFLSLFTFIVLGTSTAEAIPAFARTYNISCMACHSAYPKLNAGGHAFAANGFRLGEGAPTTTINTGDERLWLPQTPALAVRIQGYLQARDDARNFDSAGNVSEANSVDIQAPYLVKLLSGGAISKQLSYYFYAIFAEKGDNGEALVEDAWFRYSDIGGSGVSVQLGQFQVSDLMFPREVRLNFQDYMVYRLAGITYERGLLVDKKIGSVDVGLGVVNGNGVKTSAAINGAGLGRSDRLFDDNDDKSLFTRFGFDISSLNVGLFGLKGRQFGQSGNFLKDNSSDLTDKIIYGIDLSAELSDNVDIYAQGLVNQWNGFDRTQPDRNFQWWGGFVGIDYIFSRAWAFSFLHNLVDAGDFKSTDTIYRGLAVHTTSLTASHYVATNAKVLIEFTYDWLDLESKNVDRSVGHHIKENSLVVGFDAAF